VLAHAAGITKSLKNPANTEFWSIRHTAPYFHDNSAKSLEEVAAQYTFFFEAFLGINAHKNRMKPTSSRSRGCYDQDAGAWCTRVSDCRPRRTGDPGMRRGSRLA